MAAWSRSSTCTFRECRNSCASFAKRGESKAGELRNSCGSGFPVETVAKRVSYPAEAR